MFWRKKMMFKLIGELGGDLWPQDRLSYFEVYPYRNGVFERKIKKLMNFKEARPHIIQITLKSADWTIWVI